MQAQTKSTLSKKFVPSLAWVSLKQKVLLKAHLKQLKKAQRKKTLKKTKKLWKQPALKSKSSNFDQDISVPRRFFSLRGIVVLEIHAFRQPERGLKCEMAA